MADWNDYRYFLALARAGTLAGAARELGVEHTTVSRRIAALEAALETKLFVRTPDGFVPTAAGTEALPHVEQAAAALDTLERRIAGEDGELRGTVRLTTSEGFSAYLVKTLVELRARHPEIIVEVLAGNQTLDLTRREADLAIRLQTKSQPELLVRKLGEIGWGVYAAEAYLARAGTPPHDDLAGHDIVGYDEERSHIPGARYLDAHGQGGRVVLRCNNFVAALNACAMGMGIASVPCFYAAREPTLRQLGPTFGHIDIHMVVHPDLARVGRIRAVMDFLVDVIRRDGAMLRG